MVNGTLKKPDETESTDGGDGEDGEDGEEEEEEEEEEEADEEDEERKRDNVHGIDETTVIARLDLEEDATTTEPTQDISSNEVSMEEELELYPQDDMKRNVTHLTNSTVLQA